MQLRRKAAILSLPVTSGCTVDVELAPQESYEAIDPNQLSGSNPLENTLVKTLDIPEENFKLVAEFGCDSASEQAWRITSDKDLYIKAYTKGLPEDTKVFIDNVILMHLLNQNMLQWMVLSKMKWMIEYTTL